VHGWTPSISSALWPSSNASSIDRVEVAERDLAVVSESSARERAIVMLPEHSRPTRSGSGASSARRVRSRLRHPNVAQIHGADQIGDTRFSVVELVPSFVRGAVHVQDVLCSNATGRTSLPRTLRAAHRWNRERLEAPVPCVASGRTTGRNDVEGQLKLLRSMDGVSWCADR
jgi:hypothetical protein